MTIIFLLKIIYSKLDPFNVDPHITLMSRVWHQLQTGYKPMLSIILSVVIILGFRLVL